MRARGADTVFIQNRYSVRSSPACGRGVRPPINALGRLRCGSQRPLAGSVLKVVSTSDDHLHHGGAGRKSPATLWLSHQPVHLLSLPYAVRAGGHQTGPPRFRMHRPWDLAPRISPFGCAHAESRPRTSRMARVSHKDHSRAGGNCLTLRRHREGPVPPHAHWDRDGQ